MAMYIKFVSRAPFGLDVSVDYPYVTVRVDAYTTPDFQGGTEIANWTVDTVTFTGTIPRTGNVYTVWGDVPDERWGAAHFPKQDISGSLSYSTIYNFQTAVTGHSATDEAEVTSDVWEFTTEDLPLPGKPINPTPEHTKAGINLDDTTVTWESGGNTDSYIVYRGILSGMLTPFAEGVTDLSIVLRGTNWPHYSDPWYWRIDAVNETGTTTGDEWYFVTLRFNPPLPTGITLSYAGDDDGVPTGTPTGENSMVTLHKLVAAAYNKIWIEDI